MAQLMRASPPDMSRAKRPWFETPAYPLLFILFLPCIELYRTHVLTHKADFMDIAVT